MDSEQQVVAIIRQKPRDLTARQHAEKLSGAFLKSLHNDDQEDVETIAPTDIQLVSTSKDCGITNEGCKMLPPGLRTGNRMLPSLENSHKKTNVVATESSQPEVFEVENKRFMQSVVCLNAMDFSKSLHKEDDLKRCVTNINNFYEIMSREALSLPASCLCQAADAILHIMELWPCVIERGEFMKGVCDLVDLVLMKLTLIPTGNFNWSSVHRKKMAVTQMLAIFMKSKSAPLTTTILDTLIEAWENFCDDLRASRFLIKPLDSVLFENSFYIIHCLQLISKQWLAGHCLNRFFLQETQERLDKSLLHLIDTFPLVSHAVWKVTAVIEKTFQDEMT